MGVIKGPTGTKGYPGPIGVGGAPGPKGDDGNAGLTMVDNGDGTYTITTTNPPQSITISNGSNPVYGSDYFDGSTGDYISFVYGQVPTGDPAPVVSNDTGEYDGFSEVMPLGSVLWRDDPVFTAGMDTYMSTNRYVHDNTTGGTGTWSLKYSAWSVPTLFGKPGTGDPQGQFTSYVFQRSSVPLLTAPQGGSYASPNPTTPGWSDGIPGGSNAPIYVSKAIFTTDGALPQKQSEPLWDVPQLLSQSGTGVKHRFSDTQFGEYHDTPVTTDEWMLVSTWDPATETWIDNDKSTAIRIKGETGEAPQTSLKSFVFKRAVDAATAGTPVGGNYLSPLPSPANGWEDGVPVGSEDIYISMRLFTSDGLPPQETGWHPPKLFSGEGPLFFRILSDSQMINYDGQGLNPSPTSIAFEASSSNTVDPIVWTTVPVLSGFPYSDGDTFTLTEADFATAVPNTLVRVTATQNGLSDTITVIRTQDGTLPVKGVDYTDGLNSKYISKVYKSAATIPSGGDFPTGGTWDGVNEVLPAGWSDDALSPAAPGHFVWESFKEYTASLDVNGVNVWDNSQLWNSPIKYSYIPEKGTDYADGDSVFISYVFRTEKVGTTPVTPTNGSYDGTNEIAPTLPAAWSDDPTFPAGDEIVWVSKCTYTRVNGVWSAASWSLPSPFSSSPTLIGYLTNESAIVATDTEGNNGIYDTYLDAQFVLYLGGTEVTNECTFAQGTTTGTIAITISATGLIEVTDMTTDTAIVEFTATHTASGQTFTTAYTLTKVSAPRGAGHYYDINTSYTFTDWPDNDAAMDALADAATPGENVVDDLVTISNDGTFAYTKIWDGSNWVYFGEVIDGNLLVDGTVNADKLITNFLGAYSGVIGELCTAPDPEHRVCISSNDPMSFWIGEGAGKYLSNGRVTYDKSKDEMWIKEDGLSGIGIRFKTGDGQAVANVGATAPDTSGNIMFTGSEPIKENFQEDWATAGQFSAGMASDGIRYYCWMPDTGFNDVDGGPSTYAPRAFVKGNADFEPIGTWHGAAGDPYPSTDFHLAANTLLPGWCIYAEGGDSIVYTSDGGANWYKRELYDLNAGGWPFPDADEFGLKESTTCIILCGDGNILFHVYGRPVSHSQNWAEAIFKISLADFLAGNLATRIFVDATATNGDIINGIAADYTDSDRIVFVTDSSASFSAHGANKVVATTNGNNWVERGVVGTNAGGALANQNGNQVHYVENDLIFIGSGWGDTITISDDFGVTWTQHSPLVGSPDDVVSIAGHPASDYLILRASDEVHAIEKSDVNSKVSSLIEEENTTGIGLKPYREEWFWFDGDDVCFGQKHDPFKVWGSFGNGCGLPNVLYVHASFEKDLSASSGHNTATVTDGERFYVSFAAGISGPGLHTIPRTRSVDSLEGYTTLGSLVGNYAGFTGATTAEMMAASTAYPGFCIALDDTGEGYIFTNDGGLTWNGRSGNANGTDGGFFADSSIYKSAHKVCVMTLDGWVWFSGTHKTNFHDCYFRIHFDDIIANNPATLVWEDPAEFDYASWVWPDQLNGDRCAMRIDTYAGNGTRSNHLLTTVDGGVSWQDNGVPAISQPDDNDGAGYCEGDLIITGCEYGNIFAWSNDFGVTWSEQVIANPSFDYVFIFSGVDSEYFIVTWGDNLQLRKKSDPATVVQEFNSGSYADFGGNGAYHVWLDGAFAGHTASGPGNPSNYWSIPICAKDAEEPGDTCVIGQVYPTVFTEQKDLSIDWSNDYVMDGAANIASTGTSSIQLVNINAGPLRQQPSKIEGIDSCVTFDGGSSTDDTTNLLGQEIHFGGEWNQQIMTCLVYLEPDTSQHNTVLCRSDVVNAQNVNKSIRFGVDTEGRIEWRADKTTDILPEEANTWRIRSVESIPAGTDRPILIGFRTTGADNFKLYIEGVGWCATEIVTDNGQNSGLSSSMRTVDSTTGSTMTFGGSRYPSGKASEAMLGDMYWVGMTNSLMSEESIDDIALSLSGYYEDCVDGSLPIEPTFSVLLKGLAPLDYYDTMADGELNGGTGDTNLTGVTTQVETKVGSMSMSTVTDAAYPGHQFGAQPHTSNNMLNHIEDPALNKTFVYSHKAGNGLRSANSAAVYGGAHYLFGTGMDRSIPLTGFVVEYDADRMKIISSSGITNDWYSYAQVEFDTQLDLTVPHLFIITLESLNNDNILVWIDGVAQTTITYWDVNVSVDPLARVSAGGITAEPKMHIISGNIGQVIGTQYGMNGMGMYEGRDINSAYGPRAHFLRSLTGQEITDLYAAFEKDVSVPEPEPSSCPLPPDILKGDSTGTEVLYSFEDSAGTLATNGATGGTFSSDGTATDVVFIAGIATFNGTTSFIDVNSTDLFDTEKFSICGMLNISSADVTTAANIWCQHETGNAQLQIYHDSTGKIIVHWFFDTGEVGYRAQITSESITLDQMTHLAVVYDGTIDTLDGLGRWKIYFDGLLQQATEFASSGGALGSLATNSTAHIGVGNRLTAAGAAVDLTGFKGDMAQFRVYSYDLTHLEVLSLSYALNPCPGYDSSVTPEPLGFLYPVWLGKTTEVNEENLLLAVTKDGSLKIKGDLSVGSTITAENIIATNQIVNGAVGNVVSSQWTSTTTVLTTNTWIPMMDLTIECSGNPIQLWGVANGWNNSGSGDELYLKIERSVDGGALTSIFEPGEVLAGGGHVTPWPFSYEDEPGIGTIRYVVYLKDTDGGSAGRTRKSNLLAMELKA